MNKSDLTRNYYMLKGCLAKRGYDWWWHSFTGYNKSTGEEKSFFIEYFIVNPALSKDRIILGQLDENKEKKLSPSYVMIKVGCWGENKKQIHSFYPISELKITDGKLELSVGNNYLSETMMSGEVVLSDIDAKNHPEYMCDAGSMKWNLKINKKIAFHVGYGASKFFRTLNAFEMFWHAGGMKTEYAGSVVFDGVEYEVIPKKSFGYADKNWGGDYTSPWVWLSSCNMRSLLTGKELNNSVFNIGGGRPKVFGFPLDRKLLIDLFYEGKDYEFNFSKFWTFTKTTFNCYETENEIVWDIVTENKKSILEIKSSCKKKDMLLINYEAPNGTKKHNRLWNGGNGIGEMKLFRKNREYKEIIDHIEFKNAGCEYGQYTENLLKVK